MECFKSILMRPNQSITIRIHLSLDRGRLAPGNVEGVPCCPPGPPCSTFLPSPQYFHALPRPSIANNTLFFLFVLICSALAGHVRAHRVFLLRWLITAPSLAGGQRVALISPESRRIWGLKPVLNSMSFSQSGPLIPAACCPQSPRERPLPSPVC